MLETGHVNSIERSVTNLKLKLWVRHTFGLVNLTEEARDSIVFCCGLPQISYLG